MPLDRSDLKPLDVVEVPLQESAATEVHPEDWRVTGDRWNVLDTLPPSALRDLTEEPARHLAGQVVDR